MSKSSHPPQPALDGADGPPPADGGHLPEYGRYLPADGSAAPSPTPWSEHLAPDGPPRPLRLAVSLMWVGAVLSLLGAVVAFFMVDTVNALVAQEFAAQGMPELATPEFLSMMEGVIVAGIVAGGVISAGLWSWMAVKNGQGRSWARVVGTVLAGLYALNFLSGLAQAGVAGTAVLGVLQLALVVTTVVLMWQRASSDHYAARSVARP